MVSRCTEENFLPPVTKLHCVTVVQLLIEMSVFI